ncbi:Two-component sensor histidine kinase (fragment) [Flavobacterium sp. 9AF]|uniref:hypothetical protein n=1 Tax=Flavobacterium sp. 9AF TaxID=2653142 RepID=UPI0012F344F2
MRKIFYFILANAFIISINAQRFNTLNDDKHFIDSLTILIQSSSVDSIKCLNSFKLADLYRRNGDIQHFYEYLKIGKKNISKSQYLKASSQYYFSLKYLVNGDVKSYKNSIISTLQKIKKFKIKESYELQVIILQNLSIINRMEDNEKESLRILVEDAIPIAYKSQNDELIGEVEKHIGIALMNNEERSKADEYFKKANKNFSNVTKKSPVFKESTIELNSIAAENCFYMKKIKEGKQYLDKAQSILKKYPTSNLNNLYYYSEGLLYFIQNDYPKALLSYNMGIKNSINTNDFQSLNRLKFVKYQTLFELKRYKDAFFIIFSIKIEYKSK